MCYDQRIQAVEFPDDLLFVIQKTEDVVSP